jgi:hypothetical protein
MIGIDHIEANEETVNRPCFMANPAHIKFMTARTPRKTFDIQAASFAGAIV